MPSAWLTLVLLFAPGPKRPLPPTPRLRAAIVTPKITGIITVTATPATISFNAINPDAPLVAGNTPAAIAWQADGLANLVWNLTVQGDSAAFLNCPGIPISAVLVSCSRASLTGTGGSGVCHAPFPLSASPQTAAGGNQGAPTASYQVNLNFTLSDSWKYVAQLTPPCATSLTYIVNSQ